PSGTAVDAQITIPTVSVPLSMGTALKTQLAVPTTVNVTISVAGLEGSFDNAVIAHEWGHYISNRLISGGHGTGVQVTRGMGEGWADFHALLLIVRPEDINVASNANWSGTYGVGVYDTQNMYFAIRRFPYSTQMNKNPLTFKHITRGVALPTTAPQNPGSIGT